MKSPNKLLYGETFAAINRAIQLLDKEDLSEKEVNFIKGTLMDGSFLCSNAYSDDMFGFMDKYNTLKTMWNSRRN